MIKAAKQGDAETQFYLGLYYFEGKGGVVDKADTVKWFLQSAEQGYSEAQFAMGMSYNHAEEAVGDVVEAYKWFLLTGVYGDEPTGNLLGSLVEKMTPEQIIEMNQQNHDDITKALQCSDLLLSNIRVAHNRSCQDNPTLEILLRGILGDAVNITNQLSEVEAALR